MNIFNKIKEAKNKAVKFKDNYEQQKAIKVAQQLKALKQEKQKLQGRAKIYNLQRKEQQEIKDLKRQQFNNSTLGKLSKSLKDNVKKNKKNKNRQFGRLVFQT